MLKRLPNGANIYEAEESNDDSEERVEEGVSSVDPGCSTSAT
jgi:hypothetical protein